MTIETGRLILRPLVLTDAADVQRLAGAYEVAYNTLTIPHPYPDGAAEEWIQRQIDDTKDVTFAITEREGGAFAGVIGLMIDRPHDRAEIGYWIAVPYWGRGYASEAAKATIRYGFRELMLNRIFAAHFSRNPASGAVMRKVGMTYEGRLRQNDKKWGEHLDVEMYSILRGEWVGE